MEGSSNMKYKKKDLGRTLWFSLRRMKMYALLILVLAAIISAAFIIRTCRNNTLTTYTNSKIGITPVQVAAIEEIGEWEFLSVEDEEMVDTTRKGFFKDDELIRIYYGTLRLGINMNEAEKNWVRRDGDTLIATLPQIVLLDNDFIDEARTQSFFETGKWSDKDRESMYRRAYTQMKERCLTAKNIENAKANASRQFHQMFKVMGVDNVKIQFNDKKRDKKD